MDLTKFGEPISIKANSKIEFHAIDKIWIVKKGAISLFIVKNLNGKSGHRTHLFTVSTGNLATGFKIPEVDSPYRIIAVTLDDTELIVVNKTQLKSLFKDKTTQAYIIDLFETWINALLKSFSGNLIPKKLVSIKDREQKISKNQRK